MPTPISNGFYLQGQIQDFGMGGALVDQGAAGAEGGGEVWGGVSPSPMGMESGEGAVPRKFFYFLAENSAF